MARSKPRRLMIVAVAAMLGGACVTAKAADYSGSFDPIDFIGTYSIHIDDNCLLTNGWIPNNGACGQMYMISAQATTQANTTSPDPFFPSGGVFNFDLTQAQGAAALLGILVSGNAFQSPDTNLIHWTSTTPTTPNDWWIQFTSGTDPCITGAPQGCSVGFPLGGNVVALDAAPVPGNVFMFSGAQPNPNAPSGFAVYTSVPALINATPEPGTLGLLLGALGGGWLARRRRKLAI